MTAHPARCAGCDGSGYQPGPSIWETVNGEPHEYPTVQPCTHRWYDDDHGWQPDDEPLPRSHPRAEQLVARHVAEGIADLDAIRNRKRSTA
jgi:hypothetical protein